MPVVAMGEPVTSVGGVSWEGIGGVEEERTGLDAVDGLVGALCLVLLLREDRGDGAARLGVLGDLLDVLGGGWLGRHCGRWFVEVSSVVLVVDLCYWEDGGADWEFYHGGGVM